MSFVQYLLLLVLCSLCMPGRIVYATPALKEELECNPGTRCNCIGSNLTVMSCNISNGLFTLPIDLPPQLRSVNIVGQNYSIHISHWDYGDSWQTIENIEIFGDDDEGYLHLYKTFTDQLRRTKLFRIRNVGLRSIDLYAFTKMRVLEHLDLSNNAFLSYYQVIDGLTGFESQTLKISNVSGIHSGKRMAMFNILRSYDLFDSVRDSNVPLSSVRHLDISWTRAFHFLAPSKSLVNLTILNISGTHLYQSFDCLWNLMRLEHLQEIRMDYWPSLASSTRRTRASRNETYTENYIPLLFNNECPTLTNGCYLLPSGLKRLHLMHTDAAEFYIGCLHQL